VYCEPNVLQTVEADLDFMHDLGVVFNDQKNSAFRAMSRRYSLAAEVRIVSTVRFQTTEPDDPRIEKQTFYVPWDVESIKRCAPQKAGEDINTPHPPESKGSNQ